MTRTTETTEEIHQERVYGAGGRARTVWVGCGFGCWHGSYKQATKCVERAAQAAERFAAKTAKGA